MVKNLVRNIYERNVNRITLIKLFKDCIDKTSVSKTFSKEIKDLIEKGHVVSGYVPYLDKNTSLVIYNFFSTNYGNREKLNIFIALIDSKFKVHCCQFRSLDLRETLLVNENELLKLSELSPKKNKIEYCIVFGANKRISINHAGHGGHLRYWGVWDDFGAMVHSSPLPHPTAFLRKNFNKIQNIYHERMQYPKQAHEVFHFGPLEDKIKIIKRGDLSGKIKAQAGYTLITNKNQKVTSCYHTGPYLRDKYIEKKVVETNNHIIPIPPFKDIDIELFFGECCTLNSSFKVILFEERSDTNNPTIISEKKLLISSEDSIKASDLFGFNVSSNFKRWLSFNQNSGDHYPDKFINFLYSSYKGKKIFDGVHSLHLNKLVNLRKSRALKFAPFKTNNYSPNNKLLSYLSILGSSKKDIKIRIRIFSKSNDFEKVKFFNIKKNQVYFLDLVAFIKEEGFKKQVNQIFICQFESEECNLDAYIFNLELGKNYIKKLCVDHLTGG